MTAATRNATVLIPLAAALAAPPAVRAQQVVELPARDQRLDPDFEEVFRVGVYDGADWEMFAAIPKVAFDAEGNLYVFDSGGGPINSDLRVVVFDRAGEFLREFGATGEGPGEFRMPSSYDVMRDGTTIVSDRGHQAYHIFDASGQFVRMVRSGTGTTRTSGGGGVTMSFSMSNRGEIQVIPAAARCIRREEGRASPEPWVARKCPSIVRSRAIPSAVRKPGPRRWSRPGGLRANLRRTRSGSQGASRSLQGRTASR
ncbi:MAG: 6-bladed beta-propeller [Gemmatimonadetes bacterium]|nr:6-bladed beta-propeller [Gemmatimonadota bacterium]MYE70923.1 6-bladed beta-propeller [Gemmatimonadota bacterium]MYJ68817.1 6-bladed beta-propeller [Gemmatimonadota bacterium]